MGLSMILQNLENQALTIRPDKNLIKNIGFNSNAMHTRESNELFNKMVACSLNFKLSILNM